jgi:ectoine hydroxylase-related dioxygenase (phytanoyl-CoA dioxygenase family)
MMNLFGNNSTAAPSLTESIFGSSSTTDNTTSTNNDLFSSKPIIPQQKQPPITTESRNKRPRTSKTTHDAIKKTSPEETHQQTIQRRKTQSQQSVLDQFTISAHDYHHDDELYADVRSLMKHHGLVILRNALSEQDVLTITNMADNTQRRICTVLDSKKIPYNSEVADKETFVYKELAVRCKGRMDVRNDDDDSSTKTTTTTTTTTTKLPSSLLDLTENLASSILHGAEPPSLVYSGWIFSFPGSHSQPWHTDGSPLFGNTEIDQSLPSYAINIFVGLHDVEECLVLGPTEFIVGSHHQMDPSVVMDTTTMIDMAVPAVIGKGDVLLYDYRVCHRGTANLSSSLSTIDVVAPPSSASNVVVDKKKEDEQEEETTTAGGGVVRKVLYQMYARPWFKEHLNFGEKSLFD